MRNILVYALISVFAQNVIFTGTSSIALTLKAVRKPSRLFITAGLVSLFTLLCSLTVLPLDYFAPLWSSQAAVRGLLISLAALLWYLIIRGILGKLPLLDDSIGELVPGAALSGAVIGAPMLMNINSINGVGEVVGLSIGAGLGFALAAWLVNAGMRRADNPDIPAPLRGAPMMLIYMGILAMAFSAFGGSLELFDLFEF